ECDGVRHVHANAIDPAVEVHAAIHRYVVQSCAAIGERVDWGERSLVRIEISELSALLEGDAASIPGDTAGEAVMRNQPAALSGNSPVVLLVVGIRDDACAFHGRLALFEALRDAGPVRNRLRRRVSRGRESRIA